MSVKIFTISWMMALFITSKLCLGHPDGAPQSACQSMTPAHGVAPQPSDTSPFSVTVNSAYYKTGSKVDVTIASNGTTTFKGVLIQARQAGTNSSADSIGNFSELPSHTKYLVCNKNTKGTVTHQQRLNLTSITLDWMPPSDISSLQNISFFATVVREKEIFWVKIPSKALMRDASCPPGKATCVSGATMTATNLVVFFVLLVLKLLI